MALRYASKRAFTQLNRRGFASTAAPAAEEGFFQKFMPVEVYPLVVAIGGACVLCVGACTRYVMACPDITVMKSSRLALIRPEMEGQGARFSSHRHGWDTGSSLFFSNGSGNGKKNYASEGSGSINIYE